MNPEVLIALLSGTGITSFILVVYRIWRERRGNVQRDLAGDLTLGQLFRDVARKEVLQVQHDLDELQKTVHDLRFEITERDQAIYDLQCDMRECEATVASLRTHWPTGTPPPPPLPNIDR